jgi:hypothetical protein
MADSIADIGDRNRGGMITIWSPGPTRAFPRARGLQMAARCEVPGDPAGIAGQIDDEHEVLWNRSS